MGKLDTGLGVSVSFGRFGDDTLSWEKWSHFPENKYLEEAGNLSTPGLVAQKKAYFEAHYKKVAAQKAMELEQEKAAEEARRRSDDGDLENSYGIDDKSVTCNGERSDEGIGLETCRKFSRNVVSDDDKDRELEQEKAVEDAGRSLDDPNSDRVLENSSGIDDKSVTCNGEKSEEEIGLKTCGTFSTDVVVIDDEKAMDLEQEKAVERAGQSSEEPIIASVLENSSGIDDKSVTCDGEKSEKEIGLETRGTFSTNVVVIDDEKTVEFEQEKAVEHAGRSSEEPNHPIIAGVIDDKSVTCSGDKSEEDIGLEACGTFSTNAAIDNGMKDDDSGSIRGAKLGACADYLKDEADSGEENRGSVLEMNPTVLHDNGLVPGSNAGEEVSLVAVETPPNNLPIIVETPPENEDSREQPTVMRKKSFTSNAQDIARKATIIKRTTDKIASSMARTPRASTLRCSTPTSADSTKSVPHMSKKKANESPLPKIRTYQGRFKESPSIGKCGSLNQASSETLEPKISTFRTPRNEKGLQKRPTSGRKKAVGVSPFLRSDERAEKRKEFSQNLKEKSTTREVANAKLGANSKEGKESEIKKLRQSLNFKATPMPSFYRTRGKVHSHKEGVVDNKIHHHSQCVK